MLRTVLPVVTDVNVGLSEIETLIWFAVTAVEIFLLSPITATDEPNFWLVVPVVPVNVIGLTTSAFNALNAAPTLLTVVVEASVLVIV